MARSLAFSTTTPGGPVTPTSPIHTPIIKKYVSGLAVPTDRNSQSVDSSHNEEP
ncbi:hypothetical protein HNR23_004468 [Nocardiopsis mwathae]|uniref:Uncharacterized protein n=1 Tax=Nocardiopsis mwathae TaxID=1472723 RepID=A0A7X0D7F8_9ACTN|nr:hypothetical protein [Nocardiopsis mwathae]